MPARGRVLCAEGPFRAKGPSPRPAPAGLLQAFYEGLLKTPGGVGMTCLFVFDRIPHLPRCFFLQARRLIHKPTGKCLGTDGDRRLRLQDCVEDAKIGPEMQMQMWTLEKHRPKGHYFETHRNSTTETLADGPPTVGGHHNDHSEF